MSYSTAKRCRLNELHGKSPTSTDLATHEDRGDGTAKCAIGTQHPASIEWETLGQGDVDCILCGQSTGDNRGVSARLRPRPRDPVIAESLDDRIARMRKARS